VSITFDQLIDTSLRKTPKKFSPRIAKNFAMLIIFILLHAIARPSRKLKI